MSKSLPIQEVVPEIKQQLSKSNTLILQAPPGAGKSTLLPLELLNENWLNGKKIVMLEPRRLAARSVANRMASLLHEEVGNTVGYRVRFENKIGKNTRIEVLTEGILTRQIQTDNTLEGVGLVIFDEFHERSLHADLALALCREVQQVLREDLRILIMSATLDGEKLSALLGNTPIITSEGRQYPIRYEYMGDADNEPISQRVASAVRRALLKEEGDILVFLPGVAEIKKTQELLDASVAQLEVLPLYGDLSQEQQQEALQPNKYGRRKVVLATSIAETSLTIEGIRIVVDSGLARSPRFDARSGLTKLETIKVTKDAADQRAGRAGRLGPGVCYRLWSDASQHQLIAHRNPEILDADLAPMLLELANWGVNDMRSLTWLTPPSQGMVNQAKDVLVQLDALADEHITERGKSMLRFPTHPRIAHLLLEAVESGIAALASDVASILEERDVLDKLAGVDLTLRVELLRKWRDKVPVNADKASLRRIEQIAANWRRLLKVSEDNSTPIPEEIGKLIAAAYPERIAKQQEKYGTKYILSNGRAVRLPEQDALIREPWIAVAQLDAGTKEGKVFLAAPLNPSDLSHKVTSVEVLDWDTQKGVLIARKEKRLGDLLLSSVPLDSISEEQKIKVLCKVVRSEGLSILNWTEQAIDFQIRLICFKLWCTDEDMPDMSTTHLLTTLEEWLAPYLTTVKRKEDFNKLNLLAILSSMLTWEQSQRLDLLVPKSIKVPSGSMIPVKYNPDGSQPVLAVRLQEMFGLLDTPTINEGRNTVVLHLLSPGYRPVQITQDLRSFWKNTYPDVRKELRVRYQKHHWPEDPWTAEAVRGVKRKVQ